MATPIKNTPDVRRAGVRTLPPTKHPEGGRKTPPLDKPSFLQRYKQRFFYTLRHPIDGIWGWLSSVRTAIFLITSIALLCFVGIYFVQAPGEVLGDPVAYAAWVQQNALPHYGSLTPVYDWLQFFTIFSSWYFMLLLTVLSLSIIHTEQEIAARLALPSTSPLVKLERLRLSGDEPCAIETCYFSAEEFAGLKQVRLDRVSLFSILEHEYGIQIGHADEEVDATTADAQTARLLEIPVHAAVLRIRQKIFFTTGRPGLYVLGLYRSDRHSLFIRRFR